MGPSLGWKQTQAGPRKAAATPVAPQALRYPVPMVPDAPGSYCQNCLTWNPGNRDTCVKCGTRLLIVSGDQSWEEDAEVADEEEDLDEHLLERITGLEETLRRVETYLETVSDQMGKLERAEVMLRNGLMALVQEMDHRGQLNAQTFSSRWENLVEDNLHLIEARELFTRYRARILPLAKPKSMSQLRRALLETSALLDNSQLPQAAQRLQQALALDVKNYELLYTVAALTDMAQDPDQAEAMARKVVALSPRHFEGWMLLAKLLEEIPERADEALEALRQASDLHPEEVEPKERLAGLLLEEEDLQGAFESAQEAVNLQRDGHTLAMLGEVHLARGDFAAAIPILKEASGHLPGDLPIRRMLAEAYIQGGERPKAFAILQELLLQNPGDPELLLLLDAETPAQLLTARGGGARVRAMLDEAQSWLEEDNFTEADSWLRKARRKGRSERLEMLEVESAFLKNPEKTLTKTLAFSKSDRHPRLCFMALRLTLDYLMKEGRDTELMAALQGFLEAHPKSTGAWEAALMRQAHRLLKEAVTESDLAEVRRLNAHPLPGMEIRARTLLGQYLLAMGKHREVVDLLDPLLEKEPTLINHFQLGAALAAVGETGEALFLLQEGQQADPGDLNADQAQGVRKQMQGLIKEISSNLSPKP